LHFLSVIPLDREYEHKFLDFLHNDKALHIFTISDLKSQRDKSAFWIAFENEKIIGYVLQFDEKIVHTHGKAECIEKLLGHIHLDECDFVIEPPHLDPVRKFFKPAGPLESSSKGQITTFLVIKVNVETFQQRVTHPVKKLGTEDSDEIPKVDENFRKAIDSALSEGIAFGAYQNGKLCSIATVPNLKILDDLALIRGLYTIRQCRRQGLATSACSALVAELINMGMEAMLWVEKDNIPARKVYEKVGFKETGHVLLGFKAKRLR